MFYSQKNRENGKCLNFNHLEHKMDGKIVSNNMNDIITVDKSFIKKNKDKIIGMKFFEKHDICTIGFEILTNHKIFYIIDCTEKEDRKVTLYEAKPWEPCQREE